VLTVLPEPTLFRLLKYINNNDIILYVTEVVSIVTNKIKTVADPNSNGKTPFSQLDRPAFNAAQ